MSKKGCDKTMEEKLKDRIYSKRYRKKHRSKIMFYRSPSRELRKNRMSFFRKEKGNQCSLCGYNEEPRILHFHHLWNKEFNISMVSKKTFEQVKEEVEKCILLCPNCHSKIHLKL